jgi:ribosomal protein S12 methylthiotransferase accessory factor YcaO
VFSVAPIRYRSVLSLDGGPIESIEEGQLDVFGKTFFQANARLRSDVVLRIKRQLYSDADGTGMHPYASVARHKAVSEALERWAYSVTLDSAGRNLYGFQIDASSTGMAAFPGISANGARNAARYEASERYCLLHWWEGKIDGVLRSTKWPSVSALTFVSPIGGIAVVLFKQSELGFYAYGHAAGPTFAEACDHAVIEMARHEWTIRSWIFSGDESPLTNEFERRSWFFSTPEGKAIFDARLKRKCDGSTREPEVICDSEIRGAWSRYATVWRYLFRPPSDNFMGRDDRYFYW